MEAGISHPDYSHPPQRQPAQAERPATQTRPESPSHLSVAKYTATSASVYGQLSADEF